MATLIGKVTQVIGEVFAVATDGSRRPLGVGDQVFAGEQLVTGASGAVAVAMTDGQQLTMGRESQLSLNAQMLGQGGDSQPPQDAPVTAPSADDLTDVEQLLAAIEAGADPTQEAEATAAGPGGAGSGGAGGVGGGHSFVLLDTVGGAVEPVLGFDTSNFSTGPEFPNPEPIVIPVPPLVQEAPTPPAPPAEPEVVDFQPVVSVVYQDAVGSISTSPAVVEERALAGGSNPQSNAEQASGRFQVVSPDGVSALEVQDANGNWVNVTAGNSVQGQYGTLQVDAQGNWTYTLTAGVQHGTPGATGADDQIGESFNVRVTDNDGDVSPVAVLDVSIYDDGPQAINDVNSVAEDSVAPVVGNVLSNDQVGADSPASFVAWQSTAATFGTFTPTANGGYSYLLNSDNPLIQALDTGETLTETFSYTMQDADGDTSTAMLTITITGTNDIPVVSLPPLGEGTNAQVFESGLVNGSDAAANSEFTTGTFTLSDVDGLDDLQSVTINGDTVAIGSLNSGLNVFVGEFGTLTITGYDAATGQGTYQYQLTAPTIDGAGIETDTFVISVFDGTSSSAPANIVIEIIDDVPTANADTGSVKEGATLTVNVANGVLANDVAGADGFGSSSVVGVRAGSDTATDASGNVGSSITGAYGTLTLAADGSYTYHSTANSLDANAQDHFVYTVVDGDGDLSTTTLTIDVCNFTVVGGVGGEADTSVREAALDLIGSTPASNDEVASGQLTGSGGAGGYQFSIADGVGQYGTLSVNANGQYTYTLTSPVDTPAGDNGNNIQAQETFTFTVTDANGNTGTGTLLIDIVDDIPKAYADMGSVQEGATLTVNAANGVLANDVAGADGFGSSSVVGVRAGSDTATDASGNVATSITGAYGTLTLAADGSYTYHSTANGVGANALGANAQDHFVYTVVDGDGDLSTTTLTIDVCNFTVVGGVGGEADTSVREAALDLIGSNPASNDEVASGQLTGSGGAGGYQFSIADGVGQYGTLSVNANGQYTYTLTSPVDTPAGDNGNNIQAQETFTFTVTDANGNTGTGTLLIDIVDDIPKAYADTGSVQEGATLTVNAANGVLHNDVAGADGFGSSSVVGVRAGSDTATDASGNVATSITGAYGTLTLAADGSYTYHSTANALDASAQDHFVYTVVDGDGDLSTTTLTIDVCNFTVVGGVGGEADTSVREAALDLIGSNPTSNDEVASGQLTGSGGAGGYQFSIADGVGQYGTLSVNANGQYTYTLTSPVDTPAGDNGNNIQAQETFTFTVTDANGNTGTGTLLIDIVDDIPKAYADTGSVQEGATLTVNAANGVLHNDVAGADGFGSSSVVGVRAGSDTTTDASGNVATSITGAYGTLTLAADGSYTYHSTANSLGANAQDHFVYTVVDGDGDLSTTTLTIDVCNFTVVGEVASGSDTSVREAALDLIGSDPTSNDEVASGQLTGSGGAGGYQFSIANGNGNFGTLTVDASGNYTYTLTSAPKLPAGNNGNNIQTQETFSYTVTDANGNTGTGTLVIDIVDDVPTAHDDTACVGTERGLDYNAVFVLDFSGSISNSELNVMMQAVRAAGQKLFDGTNGDVSIQLVAFSGTAKSYAAVSNFADLSHLIDTLNPADGGTRPYSGNTDFTAAIKETMAVFEPVVGASNQVFFISDGNPNEQTGNNSSLTNATAAQWSNFVNGNNINVTAVGVGGGIDNARLQDIDVDGQGAPIQVANFEDLIESLLQVVTGGSVQGNVLKGDDNAVGGGDDDVFGADGGRILSISADGQTYTLNGTTIQTAASASQYSWDASTKLLTLNTDTGVLKFYMADSSGHAAGDYQFQAHSGLDFGASGQLNEVFTYTLIDNDGDTDSANLTICIDGPEISALVVGSNASDQGYSAVEHTVPNPQDADRAGEIMGTYGKDVLLGDVGGVNSNFTPGKNYNIALILDRSGSMADASGTPGLSRLALAKDALTSLANQLAGHSGVVNVRLIPFGETASNGYTINGLNSTNVVTLIAAINGLTASGGTNYESAFKATVNWFNDQVNGGKDAVHGFEQLTFFLTDGNPTLYLNGSGNTAGSGSNTGYNELSQSVDAVQALVAGTGSDAVQMHAIGIGDGVSADFLKFFDNTPLTGNTLGQGAYDFPNDNKPPVTGQTGDPTIVNTADELHAALVEGSTTTTLAAVGADHLNGGQGDDIIFGDVINTDSLAWAGNAAGTHDGAGYQGLLDYLTATTGTATLDQVKAYIEANATSLNVAGDTRGAGDLLDGGAGNDWLFGQGGDDVLIGGIGNDHLYGGTGADTFVWNAADRGGNYHDVVHDFSAADGDKLNLSALLDGVDPNAGVDVLSQYLSVDTSNGVDTLVNVSSSGHVQDTAAVDQTITLANTVLSGGDSASIIQGMLDNNTLVS